jgi:hypothetical protein
MLKNQGQGIITHVEFDLEISVPQTNYRKVVSFARAFSLAHDECRNYVIAPIWILPRFNVRLKKTQYMDVFGKYDHVSGSTELSEQRPFEVPEKQKKLIFLDDFKDQPRGKGWLIDYWVRNQPSELMRIEVPNAYRHDLVFRGDATIWDSLLGNVNQHSGAFIDIPNLPPDTTFEIMAVARAEAGTTAKVKLWCHDRHPIFDAKSRETVTKTPSTDAQGENFRMLYTTTDSGWIRIHLHYVPGQGSIEIDKVSVRQLIQ